VSRGRAGDLAGWDYSRAGLLIPSRRLRYDRPVAVGLFAGAGGMDLGMHQAGYHVAAAVEFNCAAALTYLVNLARPGVKIHFDSPEREEEFTRAVERHLGLRGRSAARGREGPLTAAGHLAGDGWISSQPPDVRGCEHFWLADVRNLTGQEILDALGLEPGEVDVVCGGPPCQGFSKAGRQNVMDPRNSLVFDFARLVLAIRPKAFVMENVPQVATMLTPEGVPVIDALARVLADGGFGGFDAMKASLRARAGAGAVMRSDRPAAPARKGKDASRGGQLGLFGPDGDEDA